MIVKKQFRLTRSKTMNMLAALATVDEPAVTAYLPAVISRQDLETVLHRIPTAGDDSAEISRVIAGTETGTVIFWGNTRKLIIRPPFPIREKYITSGYDTEVFIGMLQRKLSIGILLVRLGYYSIGIAQDEKLITHKTGTGLVHGRQRQGGSSANRFRQRRVEQTHHFLERVVLHARAMFEPRAKDLDYFVYGGARTTITELLKHSIFFKQFDARRLPSLLDIVNPRHDVLEKSVPFIWSSQVTEWADSES